MQIIDNINHIVKNDLQDSIQPGSKLSIAAACFSIYAYQELKKQLENEESMYDPSLIEQLDACLNEEAYANRDINYKGKLLRFINHLMLV